MTRHLTMLKRILFILVLLLVIALGAVTALYFNHTPKKDNVFVDILQTESTYLEGVTINGINVSGLTLEEALPIVSEQKIQPLGTVTIQSGTQTTQINLSTLSAKRDVLPVLEEALALGTDVAGDARKALIEDVKTNGKNYEIPLIYDFTTIEGIVEQAAAELSYEAVDAKIQVLSKENEKALEEAEENADVTEDALEAELAALDAETDSTATVDVKASDLPGDLSDLVEFVNEVPGQKVEAQAIIEAIQTAIENGTLDQTIEVTAEVVEAAITIHQVKDNFKLVSTASTSFAKSPYNASNRVFNIAKASEIINGYILQPGEEFSCNTVIGPRTASGGWKAAGAISEGQSVQEVGGGICQVSSTLYNAVLMADLEIVERTPHSWPLSYVASGQDATISTGGPDFIFKNNKSTPIVLLAQVDRDSKTITCQFYGEPIEDGMEIRLVSEKVESISQPATQYQNTSSLTVGKTNTIRKGRAGSKWVTYKDYYKDGVFVKRENAPSTRYRAIAAIVERGTAPAPVTTVAPTAETATPETTTTSETTTNETTETETQTQTQDEPVYIPVE